MKQIGTRPCIPCVSGSGAISAKSAEPVLWLVFIAAIAVSLFVHELGHCSVAWLHGYSAVPTLAKEYILKPVPPALQLQIALGGILGSASALIGGGLWLGLRPSRVNSAVLAGALTLPAFYTLRFFLAGRGHDATEFQEAQAALSLSYNGHALDWIFLTLLLLTSAYWLWRERGRWSLRLILRVAIGAVIGLLFLVLLQWFNNLVFDPLLA